MLSPDEIKRRALCRWGQVLIDYINGHRFSKIELPRIGKIRSNDVRQQFGKVQQELESLMRNSKNETGIGYTVELSGQTFRRTGTHDLPNTIQIDSLDDFLHVTGKKKEWLTFTANYANIISKIPTLKSWALENATILTKNDIDWEGIIKVCLFFLSVPRPELFIRQLPIEVHTKFIEENAALLQSLLDFLIPGDIRDNRQKRFAERYFLKYDEPLIRIRILDDALNTPIDLIDFSIPLTTFKSVQVTCKRIVMTENKMNFLTLPHIPSTIAIWSGGGFNISYLKEISWLADKEIFYWGDIDEHGFQILHQLRSYYPAAKSVLMDNETYAIFEKFAIGAPPAGIGELTLLTPPEQKLLKALQANPKKNRLEQERIAQEYAERIIKDCFSQNDIL
jgi:hypothetical protein